MDPQGHLAKAMAVVPMYGFGARYFLYIVSFQHPHKVGTFIYMLNGETKVQGKGLAQGHTMKNTEQGSELQAHVFSTTLQRSLLNCHFSVRPSLTA